jgi:hypothetical protein
LNRFEQRTRSIVHRQEDGHERAEFPPVRRKTVAQHAGVIMPPRANFWGFGLGQRLAQEDKLVRMPSQAGAGDMRPNQINGSLRLAREKG